MLVDGAQGNLGRSDQDRGFVDKRTRDITICNNAAATQSSQPKLNDMNRLEFTAFKCSYLVLATRSSSPSRFPAFLEQLLSTACVLSLSSGNSGHRSPICPDASSLRRLVARGRIRTAF